MATITGVISDSGDGTGVGLIKDGPGVLVLSASNTYATPTRIWAGVLRADDGVGLPSGSQLIIDGEQWVDVPSDGSHVDQGAVLETTGTFSRTVGLGRLVAEL